MANRVARLRTFWEEITSPTAGWPAQPARAYAEVQRKTGAAVALLCGQPGFFTPRPPIAWWSTAQPISYYDTGALKSTLERLVDFDRINNIRDIRLSVGAANVRTGRLEYFDSEKIAIRPEHVMASAALPPGFPCVEVDGEPYWDGGLISNTPLQYLLDYYPRRSRLCFQVDLFHAYGESPRNLDEVAEREKDIRYSSRTRMTTESFRERHEVRHAINELYKLLPDELKRSRQGQRLYEFGCVTTMDIVQLIYRPFEPQGACKDYEFSRATMNQRWQQGVTDAVTTLQASPWTAPASPEVGVRAFDVIHDILVRVLGDDEHARPVGHRAIEDLLRSHPWQQASATGRAAI